MFFEGIIEKVLMECNKKEQDFDIDGQFRKMKGRTGYSKMKEIQVQLTGGRKVNDYGYCGRSEE